MSGDLEAWGRERRAVGPVWRGSTPPCLGILAPAANFVLPRQAGLPASQPALPGSWAGTRDEGVLRAARNESGEGRGVVLIAIQFQPRQSSLAAAAKQATVPSST